MKSPFLCALVGSFLIGAHSCSAADSTNQQSTLQAASLRRVEVEEFAALVGKPDSVLLDVRTSREFEAGHIKGAVNLDFHGESFESGLSKLDKSKTYLVYCAGGGRSALACKKMGQMNFPTLIDLAPGFSGWKNARKPVEK